MFVYRFFTSLLFLSMLSFTIEAQQQTYIRHSCSNTITFPRNSNYQTNLGLLLSSLSSNASRGNPFYNATFGRSSDAVHGLFLCRGDISNSSCEECVSTASNNITQSCPLGKIAAIWYDGCLVRYSNQSIFSTLSADPLNYRWRGVNVTDQDRFNQILSNILDDATTLALNATFGLKNFATRDAVISGFQRLYSLVQCTPDLSSFDCNTCLRRAIALLGTCCIGKQGASVLGPSCNIRYDVAPFYNQTAVVAPSAPTPATPTTSGNRATRTVIIVIASVVGALILINISVCFFSRGRHKTLERVETADDIIEEAKSLQFDFATVLEATNNFSDENKVGQGGFGVVYKGQLPNGEEIAVKRLVRYSTEGELEFKNEVVLMAKLQHRNLVKLLGFCLERYERLLIFEFVPNSSLDRFIFDLNKRGGLNWESRYKIIEGIARGLLYLHQDSRVRIIHRDLKAGNILLDAEMRPKIADFGTARLFEHDQIECCTDRIVGTQGYMAPEYVDNGQYSEKSDVFSFGLIILEIISGRKSTDFDSQNEEYFLNFAWRNWREGTPFNLIDPSLRDGLRNQMMSCIHIGLLCVQEDVTNRPTMASVATMLSSLTTTLLLPSKPAFLIQNHIEFDNSASNIAHTKLLPLSRNDVSVTELSAR